MRSLFPILVPQPAVGAGERDQFERLRRGDHPGTADAAALVAFFGGPMTLFVIGGLLLLATMPLLGSTIRGKGRDERWPPPR